MKFSERWLLCFLILNTSYCCSLEVKERHFFLSTPRSGTNLTIGLLQILTGQPVREFVPQRLNDLITIEGPIIEIGWDLLEVQEDLSLPILYRTHYGTILKHCDKNHNKLLFILRNYKECFIRNMVATHSPIEPFLGTLNAKTFFDLYLNNLALYDGWDPRNRLLIYYEDLLENPKEVVQNILQFFELPIPLDFSDQRIQTIQKEIKEKYHRAHIRVGGAMSNGEKDFHSKKNSLQLSYQIDRYIEQLHPVLFSKYLLRYQNSDPCL